MSRKDTTKIRKIVTEKLISFFKWLPLMAIGWFSQWFGLINLRSRAPEFHASLLLSPIVKQPSYISSEILRSLFTSTKQRPIANIWKAFQTSDIKLYHRKLFRGLALLAPLRFLLPVHCHGTVGSDRKTVLRPFRFELHQDNHRCGNGGVRYGSGCFTCRQKQRPR